jgi:hypothetical protein
VRAREFYTDDYHRGRRRLDHEGSCQTHLRQLPGAIPVPRVRHPNAGTVWNLGRHDTPRTGRATALSPDRHLVGILTAVAEAPGQVADRYAAMPRATAVAYVACPWGLVNISASPGCFMLPISIRIEG